MITDKHKKDISIDSKKESLEDFNENKSQDLLDKDRPGESYASLVKKQFKKNKMAVVSVYVVIFFIFIAVFADFLAYDKPLYVKYDGTTYFPVIKDYLVDLGISKWEPTELININWKKLDDQNKLESVVWAPIPYSAREIDLLNSLIKPGGDHYLGTDQVGRDLLSGLIHGSRISLSVGFVAAGIAAFQPERADQATYRGALLSLRQIQPGTCRLAGSFRIVAHLWLVMVSAGFRAKGAGAFQTGKNIIPAGARAISAQ